MILEDEISKTFHHDSRQSCSWGEVSCDIGRSLVDGPVGWICIQLDISWDFKILWPHMSFVALL